MGPVPNRPWSKMIWTDPFNRVGGIGKITPLTDV